jgi:hypothetical protein
MFPNLSHSLSCTKIKIEFYYQYLFLVSNFKILIFNFTVSQIATQRGISDLFHPNSSKNFSIIDPVSVCPLNLSWRLKVFFQSYRMNKSNKKFIKNCIR